MPLGGLVEESETQPPPGDRDEALIRELRRGDSDALAELMRRNGPWVRGVIFAACGSADAVDDVAQQVWLSAWRRAGSLNDAGKWRSWLYALARNAGVDAARRRQWRQKLAQRLREWARRPSKSRSDLAARLVAEEVHGRALKAVAALPEIYRGPFVLRHLADWSYRQIAEAIDLPIKTVETRLVRARRMLREALASENEA